MTGNFQDFPWSFLKHYPFTWGYMYPVDFPTIRLVIFVGVERRAYHSRITSVASAIPQAACVQLEIYGISAKRPPSIRDMFSGYPNHPMWRILSVYVARRRSWQQSKVQIYLRRHFPMSPFDFSRSPGATGKEDEVVLKFIELRVEVAIMLCSKQYFIYQGLLWSVSIKKILLGTSIARTSTVRHQHHKSLVCPPKRPEGRRLEIFLNQPQ